MKFYLWMKQRGEGCDYTIGCGQKLVHIKGAETLEQARASVPEVLDYYGIDDCDRRLSDAVILVEQENAMGFVAQRLAQREAEKHQQELADKRAQLERLKKELGE